MAKDNKQKFGFLRNNKKIKDNLDLLDKSLDSLYQDTFYDQRSDIDDSESIRNDIEKSISTIMSNTYSNTSVGNISKIYTKLQLDKAKTNQQLIQALDVFEDPLLMNNILATYTQNKWIRDLDYEIDTVLKYMPKLNEALKCKRDSVLSADHFAKDFVNYHNLLSQNKQELFNKRMEEIKKVYKLPQNFESWYEEAQKYGECYVYIIPYSAAFAKLLKTKNSTAFQMYEMSVIKEGALDLASEFNKKDIKYLKEIIPITETAKGGGANNIINKNSNLTVTFNTSGILLSAAENLQKAQKIINENKFASLNEMYQEVREQLIQEKSEFKVSDKLVPDDLELPKELEDDRTAQEGIITGDKVIRSDSDPKITVPGCVVKKLDRANIIPLYIDDICLGYYYLEFKTNDLTFDDPNYLELSSGLNTLGNAGKLMRNTEKFNEDNRNKIIDYIAKQLSDAIDAKFINANQDLRKEIYMILKHNEIFNSLNSGISGNITVSFLPAEDVHHIAFDIDPITHRGISDLAMSLFPAKLYSCLYINHVLGTLTRGQDKRVYYVKQNVETNIAKTLLNVLNQIKKGNFGARQMENLSSILNITGQFNDFIIPVSQSGDAPIQFEIMEGQKFDFQSELMDKLEEMAINNTDVPIELINTRQSLDYAIQATMSNSKFMRSVYKRQDIVEVIFSDIVTKIYNYEYLESETIEMTLPAPAFLNMTNGQQLIEGTYNYMNALANIQLAEETEEERAEFVKLGTNYHLASHLNMAVIAKLRQQAKINVSKRKTRDQEEEM